MLDWKVVTKSLASFTAIASLEALLPGFAGRTARDAERRPESARAA